MHHPETIPLHLGTSTVANGLNCFLLIQNNPVDGNDPQSILSFYNGVTATDSFFDNTAITNRWTVAKAWRELLDPVTVKWRMPAATVNAYQDILHNTMFFPAGIVQPPFFHKDYPSYINFGGIGMIIGHEISHGFDGTGRRYDAQGNLRDWWTDSTSTEVRRREQCFVDQYNNFTFEGPGGQTMHMNGDLTANENMADTNGLDAAYKAWKIYNEKHPEENFELPGLEHFSSDQLFFMSFAYNWCSNQTPERRANRARVDQHALEQFRVLGSLQNSVNFKQSFGCKEKGATCTVWSN
jgi:endothelin-converting enzyme